MNNFISSPDIKIEKKIDRFTHQVYYRRMKDSIKLTPTHWSWILVVNDFIGQQNTQLPRVSRNYFTACPVHYFDKINRNYKHQLYSASLLIDVPIPIESVFPSNSPIVVSGHATLPISDTL